MARVAHEWPYCVYLQPINLDSPRGVLAFRKPVQLFFNISRKGCAHGYCPMDKPLAIVLVPDGSVTGIGRTGGMDGFACGHRGPSRGRFELKRPCQLRGKKGAPSSFRTGRSCLMPAWRIPCFMD